MKFRFARPLVCLLLVQALFLETGGVAWFLGGTGFFHAIARFRSSAPPPATLVLTHAAYRQHRVNHDEIRYEGMMYDVRSVRFRDTRVILRIESDPFEAALFAGLQGAFDEARKGIPLPRDAYMHGPEYAGTLMTSLLPLQSLPYGFRRFGHPVRSRDLQVEEPPPEG